MFHAQLLPAVHLLTPLWGGLIDARRLRARSRLPKARSIPSLSTLGDGSSSCLRRAWAMKDLSGPAVFERPLLLDTTYGI